MTSVRPASRRTPAATSASCVDHLRDGTRARPNLADGTLGDEPALAHDAEVRADLLHFREQVTGHQDGRPVCGQRGDQRPDLPRALGVEPVRRLVEDEQVARNEQGGGDREALAHAERVRAVALAGSSEQADPLEGGVDAGLRGARVREAVGGIEPWPGSRGRRDRGERRGPRPGSRRGAAPSTCRRGSARRAPRSVPTSDAPGRGASGSSWSCPIRWVRGIRTPPRRARADRWSRRRPGLRNAWSVRPWQSRRCRSLRGQGRTQGLRRHGAHRDASVIGQDRREERAVQHASGPPVAAGLRQGLKQRQGICVRAGAGIS